MSVWVYAHVCRCPWRLEEGVRSARAGVTGGYKLPGMGAGIWEEREVFVTARPFLQPATRTTSCQVWWLPPAVSELGVNREVPVSFSLACTTECAKSPKNKSTVKTFTKHKITIKKGTI